MNFTQKSWKARVLNYSALAAAGLLAEPAVASVITSNSAGFTPVTVSPGQTKAINFPGLGSFFQFAEVPSMGAYSMVIQRGPACSSGNCQFVVLPYTNNPQRLGAGYVIGAANRWSYLGTGTNADIAGVSAGTWNAADGVDVRGFLGMRFYSGGTWDYGYFDVGYDNNPNYSLGTMTIYGWAYDDSGAPITTEAATPEPSPALPLGLGLLALGAAGIRAKRQKAA